MNNNPFNKLKVQREEEEFVTVTLKKQEKQEKPLAQPKKRPVEEHDEDKDGFETVGKVEKKRFVNKNTEEEVGQTKPGVNVDNQRHHKKHVGEVRVGSNQRAFDRHSGTGRGKEIKKEGAGGKGTWGNQERAAKKEVYDYDDSSDYYFNRVLHQKKEDQAEEVKELKVVEEKVEEKQEKPEEKEEEQVEYKDKKGKKKLADPVEDEKNKLIIPENAISLAEWKEKNQRQAPVQKEVKIEVKLEQISKPKDETIQVGGKKFGGEKKKVKGKEVDAKELKELELNKLVNLKIEDSSYQKKGYGNQGYGKGKGKGNGFKFDDNEFPTLK